MCQLYWCPCCGSRTLSVQNMYDICDVCFWEDDDIQSQFPNYEGGANTLSLTKYRWLFRKYKNWEKMLELDDEASINFERRHIDGFCTYAISLNDFMNNPLLGPQLKRSIIENMTIKNNKLVMDINFRGNDKRISIDKDPDLRLLILKFPIQKGHKPSLIEEISIGIPGTIMSVNSTNTSLTLDITCYYQKNVTLTIECTKLEFSYKLDQ